MRPVGEGQLFWHFDKTPLTRFQFARIVKKSLQAKHINDVGITSHSFRIGACTHFALAGYTHEELMQFGRWSSNAYSRYIRVPPP